MANNNRNKPCPCGSGNKTKRCCGSAEAEVARREESARLAEEARERVAREKRARFVRRMEEAGHKEGEGVECDCTFCLRRNKPRRLRGTSAVAAAAMMMAGGVMSGGGICGTPTNRLRKNIKKAKNIKNIK
jgi:hypothetical protein